MQSKISLIIYSSTYPKVQISLYNTSPISKGNCISIVSGSPSNAVDSSATETTIAKVLRANFPSSCSVDKLPRWVVGRGQRRESQLSAKRACLVTTRG